MTDIIAWNESRIWLKYVVSTIKESDGTVVWHLNFKRCGVDPTEEAWLAEQATLEVQESEYPTIYRRSWLDYLVQEVGWSDILRVNDSGSMGLYSEDAGLDWLLRNGIAPEQPFLVRFFNFQAARPDYWGEYDGEDWDYEILDIGKLPNDVAGEIERAWALKERMVQDQLCSA